MTNSTTETERRFYLVAQKIRALIPLLDTIFEVEPNTSGELTEWLKLTLLLEELKRALALPKTTEPVMFGEVADGEDFLISSPYRRPGDSPVPIENLRCVKRWNNSPTAGTTHHGVILEGPHRGKLIPTKDSSFVKKIIW